MYKRGLLKILGFFLLCGLLAVVLDWAIDHGLKRITTSNYGVVNRVVAGRINTEVVISGSSRALAHYDPAIIGRVVGASAFNLGQDGSHTEEQLAILKAYLRHNARPKLVVQNLDMHTFTATKDILDPVQYLPHLAEPALYATLHRMNPEVWKWRYVPLYGYAVEDMRFHWMEGLMAWFGVQPAEDRFDGFGPTDAAWNQDFDRFKRRNPEGVSFSIDPAGVRALEEIITVCQSNGVGIVLVYSPQYQEMLELVDNRTEVFARFHEIADRFQVPLWDYSQSEICGRKEFFYNSQHLNLHGSEVFTTELANRLGPELLARRQPRARLLSRSNAVTRVSTINAATGSPAVVRPAPPR